MTIITPQPFRKLCYLERRSKGLLPHVFPFPFFFFRHPTYTGKLVIHRSCSTVCSFTHEVPPATILHPEYSARFNIFGWIGSFSPAVADAFVLFRNRTRAVPLMTMLIRTTHSGIAWRDTAADPNRSFFYHPVCFRAATCHLDGHQCFDEFHAGPPINIWFTSSTTESTIP